MHQTASSGPVGERYYTNLKPVDKDSDRRVERSLRRKENRKKNDLPQRGESADISYMGDTISVRRVLRRGAFTFNVDIRLHGGLELPLSVTQQEAGWILKARKYKPDEATPRSPRTGFFSLPPEIRDRIFDFVIPPQTWKLRVTSSETNKELFPTALGNLSGFLFPFGKAVSVLRVSKEVRQQALARAFRRVDICAMDLSTLLTQLLSVGQWGRDNIRTLTVEWWDEVDYEKQKRLGLPVTNVLRCLRLLTDCKGLRSLRVKIDQHLFRDLTAEAFMADAGIRGLVTLGGRFEKFEVYSVDESIPSRSLLPHLGFLRHAIAANGAALKAKAAAAQE